MKMMIECIDGPYAGQKKKVLGFCKTAEFDASTTLSEFVRHRYEMVGHFDGNGIKYKLKYIETIRREDPEMKALADLVKALA